MQIDLNQNPLDSTCSSTIDRDRDCACVGKLPQRVVPYASEYLIESVLFEMPVKVSESYVN